MKLIPFKCRYGHITIEKFPDNSSKPSLIECSKCKEESTSKVLKYDHPYNDKKYIHVWPSKDLLNRYEPEKAVRI